MKIYISNFLRNVARRFRENRALIVRALLIAAAVLLALLLIRAGVEKWQRSKYEQKINALETEVRAADAKAQELEAQASALTVAIEAKYVELRDLKARAEIAEANLRTARRNVTPLKEAYEEIRNAPMPAAPVSCADACRELAAIGYACK